MRSIILICLCFAVPTVAAAGQLYRWVDDKGRVIYSDRPAEGAEVEEVKVAPAPTPAPAQTPRPQATTPTAPAQPAAAVAAPEVDYRSLTIVNPGEEQVLWNIGSVLTVKLAVDPALGDDHRVVVRFNGDLVGDWPADATKHSIQGVYRGTHTVNAEVVDQLGTVLVAAQPVTFYVKQTSVLN